ncbi:MAG: hypothetical protein IIT53_02645 [Fibrobacter sp.]|nr:hypothetical protein [Fibrobacter sp.]MBR4646725.1 hypothetical protein [Bacteroidales bacterium]
MQIKRVKEFSVEQALIDAFENCSPRNFREIEHFHPEGKNMPNGVAFQRGGYINECMENIRAFVLDEGVHDKQYGLKNYRGGVIVFSTDINVLDKEKGLEKYKKKFSNLWKTIKNRVLKYRKLEHIRNFFNDNNIEQFYAYSVGHAFRGKYQSDDGKLYDENSVTFEIDGISSESLLKLAELVAKFFGQETVLVKDLNKNKIYLADNVPMDKSLDDALAELNTKCD